MNRSLSREARSVQSDPTMSNSSKTASVTWSDHLNRKGYSMRKFLLASVAVFALSSAAQAANTSTTVQLGVVNGSSTTQNGLTNDSSSTTQVGLLNGQTTLQGASSASLNNAST